MSDESVFGILRHGRRIWAVASIHGEAGRLAGLHRALGERVTAGDRLVYLGNFLGHGPDVPGVLDELLSFRREFLCLPGVEPEDIVYLRGQQEEMWRKLLQIQFASAPRDVFAWMLEHGMAATLDGYRIPAATARGAFAEGVVATSRWTRDAREAVRARPGHDLLLNAIRRAAYTEDRRLLFVNAGVDPNRPLTEQGDTFWWGSGYFDRMDRPFDDFGLVVRGFSRRPDGGGADDRPANPFAVTLDEGCGFGGPLVAACYAADGSQVDELRV
ncbi:MAG: hypothetical protein RIB84_25910 [Sneathiellaceae bacterium]